MQGQSDNSLVLPAAIVVAFLALWETLIWALDVKPYILPAPSAIARSLVTNWSVLASNLTVTLTEILLGFALAAIVAFIAGTAVAFSATLRRGVYPLLVASQTVPIIAIAPVLIIWFGYNIWPRVIATALIAFFPLTVNVVTGFSSVEPELKVFFRSLHASRLAFFFKLALPSALPFIFAGLRISAVLSVIGATVSEWMGADSGLGRLIARDTAELNTVRVFACIVVLSTLGISLFTTVVVVEWLVLPWRHSSRKMRFWLRLMPISVAPAKTQTG
jgi:ABC-type nitrate/sulfonate/bicarbonate transport system permease component